MSLFIHHSKRGTMFLLVYVDDLILASSNANILDEFIVNLQARFAVKDLGILHYFLGIQAIHTNHGLILTQTIIFKTFYKGSTCLT